MDAESKESRLSAKSLASQVFDCDKFDSRQTPYQLEFLPAVSDKMNERLPKEDEDRRSVQDIQKSRIEDFTKIPYLRDDLDILSKNQNEVDRDFFNQTVEHKELEIIVDDLLDHKADDQFVTSQDIGIASNTPQGPSVREVQ